MQAARLGRSDITRTLNSAADSFSKNCSELVALQQQRPRRIYPTRARCGEPGSQAARLIHNAV